MFVNKQGNLTAAGVGCGLAVVGAAVLAIGGYLFCWVTVPKGHVGVRSTFGAVSDGVLHPGGHIIWPWEKLYRMNCQTQKNEEPATVPTKNGLSVQMKATLLYHLDPTAAPKMAREVGETGYEEKVIDPVFRNNVRDVTAEFPPEALYSAERQVIETQIFQRTQKELKDRGIVVEAVMILDPVLPQVVTDRIQAKVGAEQDAQRMEFILKQKEIEAKAKVVEAEGIAKAQTIIKQDLTHEYLVYLWIQALLEGAKHNNAVIYVPTGPDGMPLFKAADGKKK